MTPNLSLVLALPLLVLAAPLRAKTDAPAEAPASGAVESSEFLSWSQIQVQGGGAYACAGGTGWVKNFTPAVMAWKRQRGHPAQSLPVYCLSQQGDKLMKRPVAGAFVKIDGKGVRVEDDSRQATITVQPYSRPGFEKTIRDGSGAAAAPPSVAVPAAAALAEQRAGERTQQTAAAAAPARAALAEQRAGERAQQTAAAVAVAAADLKKKDDCTSLTRTTPLDFVIACVFPNEGMRPLIRRNIDRDAMMGEVESAFYRDAIGTMPAKDDDSHEANAKSLARIKMRDKWYQSAAKQFCSPPDFVQSAPSPMDCKKADEMGNTALAEACQAHDEWLREAKAKADAVAAGKPEDPIDAECRQAKAAAVVTGSGETKSNFAADPPTPPAEAQEPGFFQKYGKPVGAVAGALAGLAVALLIGGGPLGLLAVGALALGGWFAGGYLADKGLPPSPSAASAPSSRGGEGHQAP